MHKLLKRNKGDGQRDMVEGARGGQLASPIPHRLESFPDLGIHFVREISPIKSFDYRLKSKNMTIRRLIGCNLPWGSLTHKETH